MRNRPFACHVRAAAMLKSIVNDTTTRFVMRACCCLAAVLVSIRFLGLYALIPMVLFGMRHAIAGKPGFGALALLLVSVIQTMNPLVIYSPPLFRAVSRVSSLLLCTALFVGSMRSGDDERPPLSSILVFLAVAFVSSIQGYCPMVSYLKLINFATFAMGIAAGVANIGRRPGDIILIRGSLLALSVMYVWGSIATLPFPAVAYLTSLASRINAEGVAAASAAFRMGSGNGLFSGITCHSQFLGPCLGCVFGLVASDMLMIERRASPIHILILLPIPVLIAKTQSRIGLVTFVVAMLCLSVWLIPKIKVSQKDKLRIKKIVRTFIVAVIILACVFEVRHSTVSKLLRKTTDVSTDERTLVNAFTSSRKMLIEISMQDFRRNPVWGKGFQVDESFVDRFANSKRIVFSATIEKGVLPTMILGETGVVGLIAFVFFLWVFYSTCANHRYFALTLLFTTFLASNFGEATFFSPGGAGGVLWIICVVGGFTIDMAKRNSVAAPPAPVGTLPLNPYRRSRIPLEAGMP